MKFIVDKLAKFNSLNIIGVYRKENSDLFYLLKTSKNKSKLEITTAENFENFEELILAIDNKIPVIILVDGKGVLNKKIELKNEADIEWKRNLDYSNIHFLDYFTPSYQFLSFCRKNVVEDIILLFQSKGFQIIDFYVGSIVSAILNSTLKKSKLFSNQTILDFENDELIDILKNKEENQTINYELDDKVISKNHLPLYASAIHFYVKNKTISKSQTKLIDIEEFFYKKAFDKLGISMIIGFFTLLLVSYGLIQYYNSKNAQLNLENVYSSQSFELIKKLEEQRKNKLKLVNDTGISSSKFISFYSYAIASSVSNEINLTTIDVFPLLKDIKNTERVEFSSKIILVNGFTDNEPVLNFWLEKIRKFNWIKNLEIISIKKDKKNNSYFELKITLKNV